MSSTDVPQVKAYLAELERALDALPRDRRVEVLRDIRAHIGGALADSETSTARVASVLDSLGTPQEIADAAYEEMPPEPTRMAGRDISAVILVLVGGFLWGIGWLVGVILLWTSPAWRTRDKWIGSLVVPGGLAGPVVVGGLVVARTGMTSEICSTTVPVRAPLPVESTATLSSVPPTGAGGATTCTSTGGGVPLWISVTLFVIMVAAPFFTTYWLIRTARRTR